MADERSGNTADAHWLRMVDQCSGKPASPGKHPRPGRTASRSPSVLPSAVQGPPSERDVLQARLPEVAQHLRARRVDLISQRDIGQYLALEWLEWHGGSLRLTAVGHNVCDQVVQRENNN
nr:hypothetical protein [uncultured Caldimonas sp.]